MSKKLLKSVCFLVLMLMLSLIYCFIDKPITIGYMLVIFFTAFCCEYMDSSLGMGYGTTLTPILLLSGFTPLQIVPCILFSEFVTGLFAAILHHNDGNVDFINDNQAKKTSVYLSILSIIGTITAVVFALHVSKIILTSIIGTIIILAGILTLFTINRKLEYNNIRLMIVGAIAAFNKGLSGGGYGPLVTSGQVVSGLSPKKAIAITSLSESFTCIIGLITYVCLKNNMDWTLLPSLMLGAIASVPFATFTVSKLSEKSMRVCVGVVTCLLGIITVIKIIL